MIYIKNRLLKSNTLTKYYKMGLFYKYWLGSTILGSYIFGYETSILRDRSKDTYLFFKYLLGSPVSVPIYIYKKKGLPSHYFDSNI